MTGEEFWALIDASRPAAPDPDVHAQAITRALVDRGAAETVAFARHFDAAHDALHRWDVWGVIHLLRGGCSEDSFDYARAWVVGEGRTTWERVAADPEAWAVAVVDGVVATDGELSENLQERGFDDGESLLYAAGTAHEQLTGAWISADAAHQDGVAAGPAGEEWDEDEVDAAFPRLAAAIAAAEFAGAVNSDLSRVVYSETFDIEGGGRLTLEEISTGIGFAAPGGAGPHGPGAGDPSDAGTPMTGVTAQDLQLVVDAIQGVEERWSQGDHAGVVAALTPVLDHFQLRRLLMGFLPDDMAAEVLYCGGISRMQCGDPDGAAEWLGIAVAAGVANDRVRRALAQLLMTRGELGQAEGLLDTDLDAAPMDLAIATAVAGYRRDHAEVLRRSETLFAALGRSVDLHPWDMAGMCVLVGQAMVDVGEGERALAAADRVRPLVEDAPPEVPIAAQAGTVVAGGHRLVGDLAAAESALRAVWPRLQRGTCDLGVAEREAARIHRASGRPTDAADLYARAVATFTSAGERFLATVTEWESATG